MILDGANFEDRQKIQSQKYDICIVGAGAVGISMAQRIASSSPNTSVILLESSIENEKYQDNIWSNHPRFRDSNQFIREIDEPEYDTNSFWFKVRSDFFTQSRTRALGGSTNCWGGFFRPLDEYDFTNWPIKRKDLDPYYREALSLVGLKNFDKFDDPESWQNTTPLPIKPFPSDPAGLMKTVMLMHQPDTNLINFQEQFAKVFNSPNITLVRNATAHRLVLKENLVDAIQFKSLDESQHPSTAVVAKNYVLAMGGMEIPRFLLNNLGNSQFPFMIDVGKYYMNHPKYEKLAVVRAEIPIEKSVVQFYQSNFSEESGGHIQGLLVPTQTGVQKYKTNNFRLALNISRSGVIELELNFEQFPNRDSEILISDSESDIFDVRRAKLNWKFSEIDAATVNSAAQMVVDYLTRINAPDWHISKQLTWDFQKDSSPPHFGIDGDRIYTGDHHLGTCRMNSKNELKDGVVDSNCKVIDTSNLWICSTGIFRSGGWANSTFTLLALALRLTDHLLSVQTNSD